MAQYIAVDWLESTCEGSLVSPLIHDRSQQKLDVRQRHGHRPTLCVSVKRRASLRRTLTTPLAGTRETEELRAPQSASSSRIPPHRDPPLCLGAPPRCPHRPHDLGCRVG